MSEANPARKRARKRDLQLAEDWKAFYETAAGKRAIADLMAWCDAYTQISENDPIKLAMAVGAENVAKRLAYYLGLQPSHFPETSWEHLDLVHRMTSSQH
jgi:hypothetical protein